MERKLTPLLKKNLSVRKKIRKTKQNKKCYWKISHSLWRAIYRKVYLNLKAVHLIFQTGGIKLAKHWKSIMTVDSASCITALI